MAKDYLYLSDVFEQELFTEFWDDFCSRCPDYMSCARGPKDEECIRHSSYLKLAEAVKEFNIKLADAVNE